MFMTEETGFIIAYLYDFVCSVHVGQYGITQWGCPPLSFRIRFVYRDEILTRRCQYRDPRNRLIQLIPALKRYARCSK